MGPLIEATLKIQNISTIEGRPRYEANLISEDNQIIYIHEGQLKEVDLEPEVGESYRVTLKVFINNRWFETKIIAMRKEEAEA